MTAGEILKAITRLNALVIGDICLDRWCAYDPSANEISRETGIPRTGVVRTEVTPGAAGTVANNLVALGAQRVAVLGAIGDDGFGFELTRALAAGGISADLAVRSPEISTFTYTKLINEKTGVEDLPRVDFITNRRIPESIESSILRNLRESIGGFDVILVSDQAETNAGGVITPTVRDCLSGFALVHPEKVIWVDSRKRGELFRNIILKANDDEMNAACVRVFGEIDYKRLRAQTEAPVLIVTEGSDGVLVIDEIERHVATKPNPAPVDICGAGDSFSAAGALALAVTRCPVKASKFGNMVASITITKKGTGTASPVEVLAMEKVWPE